MPYSKLSELPEQVKGYPKHAQEIWMAAFNAASKKYPREEQWFKVAWAALKHKYQIKGK